MAKKLPTIKVQGGKEYVMVKDRVIAFNEIYKDGSIQTEIVRDDDKDLAEGEGKPFNV